MSRRAIQVRSKCKFYFVFLHEKYTRLTVYANNNPAEGLVCYSGHDHVTLSDEWCLR